MAPWIPYDATFALARGVTHICRLPSIHISLLHPSSSSPPSPPFEYPIEPEPDSQCGVALEWEIFLFVGEPEASKGACFGPKNERRLLQRLGGQGNKASRRQIRGIRCGRPRAALGSVSLGRVVVEMEAEKGGPNGWYFGYLSCFVCGKSWYQSDKLTVCKKLDVLR